MNCVERMSLVKSIVYEVMRIEPAVPYQYAKAKENIIVNSQDDSFQIKKGEMLFVYQPFAMKDSRTIEKANEFVAKRFIGDKGERLLKYVV
ncbi:hypothetical protein AHAS_Ahas18G0136500 [Arachis hypogaea]